MRSQEHCDFVDLLMDPFLRRGLEAVHVLEESESEGWEWNGHEPSERTMHVFNMVDSPLVSERQGHAKGMHGPLLLKQSKMDKIKTLLKSIHILKIYIFIYFCHTTQCVGSYFSNQRLSSCPSALEVWSLNHRTIREASEIKTLDGPKSLFLLGGRS